MKNSDSSKNRMLAEDSSDMSNAFSRLLTPSCTRSLVNLENQKRTLQYVAELLQADIPELSSQDIMEHLVARENLGSCSLGHNVALPHSRISNITAPYLSLITLKKPIIYDELNNESVDIICTLLVPEKSVEQYMDILAELASWFSNQAFRDELRLAQDNQQLYQRATLYPK